MSLINLYMSTIAFLGSCVYYIQSVKIFKTKSASDLSLPGYMISLFTSLNWLTYGYFISDIPLIASGSISALGAGLVICGMLLYSK